MSAARTPATLYVLAGLVAASFVAFAAHVYPVPNADSHAFLPPALLLEAGGGLRNPISDLAWRLDPEGARYLQYPPLFQIVLALLMWIPSPRAAFLAIAAINMANVGLTALLLVRSARGRTPGPVLWLTLLGVSTALLGQQTGRPEILATFWTLLSTLLHLALPPERAWPMAGVLLGLLGATHPLGGLLLGLSSAALFAFLRPPRVALALSTGVLALSLVTFFGVLAMSPSGLRDSLGGIFDHSALVFGSRGAGESLKTYWLTHPGASFFAFPYLLFALGLAWSLSRRRASPRSPWLFIAVLLPTLWIIWGTGFRHPQLNYNILLFTPLVFAANLALTAECPRSVRVVTALAHGAAAAGYLRALVLFAFFLTGGVPLKEARAAFVRINPGDARVAVTPSLWVISEQYERMTVFPLGSALEGLDAETYVVQQNYSGLQEPPDLPGFTLIENRFIRHPCEVFGLSVANTTPGYGYAVYRRQGSRSPREPNG